MARKKTKIMLSAYSIILILIVVLGVITHILPDAKYTTEEVDGKTCLEMYYAEEVTIDSCTTTINDFTTQELNGETCSEKIGNETEFIPTSCKIEKFVDGSDLGVVTKATTLTTNP